MYHTFVDYYRTGGLWANTYWGTTWNVVVPVFAPGTTGPSSDSAQAGCDAPGLVDSILNAQTFTVDVSPVDQLAERGLPVAASFSMDFNGDGTEDWVVWIAKNVKRVFFLSSDNTYKISRPSYLDYVDEYSELYEWELPDGEPALLIYRYDPRPDDIRVPGILGGPIPQCEIADGELELPRGELSFWRLEEGELDWNGGSDFCEPTSLEEIFPDGVGSTQLYGWESPKFDEEMQDYLPLEPAVLVWDEKNHYYHVPKDNDATSSSSSSEDSSQRTYDMWTIRRTFTEMDYLSGLEMIDANIAQFDEETSDKERYEMVYYRALALEGYGSDHEAQLEYEAMYEETPDSVWGMMAQVHLQPDE